jgi:hypothetical protein
MNLQEKGQVPRDLSGRFHASAMDVLAHPFCMAQYARGNTGAAKKI